jgi:hypothetical protein
LSPVRRAGISGHRDADQSAKIADQAKQIDDLKTQRDEFNRRVAAQSDNAKNANQQRTAALADAFAARAPLAACSSVSTNSSRPPAIPPLPPEARQPETPSICLPTCSAALANARASWRNMLTGPVLPASSASGITTR